jgi:hypothetical protein
MQKNRRKSQRKNNKITKIEITNDKISGRGGIAFFLRYVEQIGFYPLAEKILGHIQTSSKGLSLYQFIKQALAYFIDGTYMSMSSFDDRKKDSGYTALLENQAEAMSLSHQMKRFFRKLMDNHIVNAIYRKFLHTLFIWRLQIEQPEIIILGVDTMVMDNNDAHKREGVEPTYKKKKGYQPLHISWGSYLVDITFRSGSCHSNHGTDFIDSVRDITELIRKKYKTDIPIIAVCDSGFLDEKAFTYFEEVLKIGYVISGKFYGDVKDYIVKIGADAYKKFQGNGIWNYIEFCNKLNSWSKFRRAIYTTLDTEENGQLILDFEKPDTILYTNIGQDAEFTEQLRKVGKEDLITADSIIRLAHQRGKDELIHRSIKELATKEQLPFQQMEMNRAYYYLLAISHFLFESYKRDVTYEVLPTESYPNTFRRQLIDFAVKVVSHGGEIILKVTNEIKEQLNIYYLWELCQSPPVITA